jgi:predicted Zn-dependent peptidase
VWVYTAREKVSEARDSLLKELEMLKDVSVDKEEVSRRVNFRVGRLRMRMLSSITRAYYLALAELKGQRHVFGREYQEMLGKVTPKEVREAMTKHFEPKDYVMVLVD